MEKRSDNQTTWFVANINKKTLDGSHFDELGTFTRPWPGYQVITATDKGKSLHNLSPFAIHKGVKGIAGLRCCGELGTR